MSETKGGWWKVASCYTAQYHVLLRGNYWPLGPQSWSPDEKFPEPTILVGFLECYLSVGYRLGGAKLLTRGQGLVVVMDWKQGKTTTESYKISAANRLIGEVVQSRRRPLLQGVQQNCSHLVICSFAGFYSCKLQSWEVFEKFRKFATW